jgi:uncharacterized coiled-coil protein SlyX
MLRGSVEENVLELVGIVQEQACLIGNLNEKIEELGKMIDAQGEQLNDLELKIQSYKEEV